MQERLTVAIIGTGYVGLVSGACLAECGQRVICVDVDATKVGRINAGESPIHEAGLDELLQRHRGGALTATTDLRSAVMQADVTLIAVGTPARNGRIDLTYVEQAAAQVGEVPRVGWLIFLGLVGAWYSAIKHHKPDFTVKFGWKDAGGIVVGCLAYVFVVLPLFLKYKGEM